jgi:hypothetical protein
MATSKRQNQSHIHNSPSKLISDGLLSEWRRINDVNDDTKTDTVKMNMSQQIMNDSADNVMTDETRESDFLLLNTVETDNTSDLELITMTTSVQQSNSSILTNATSFDFAQLHYHYTASDDEHDVDTAVNINSTILSKTRLEKRANTHEQRYGQHPNLLRDDPFYLHRELNHNGDHSPTLSPTFESSLNASAIGRNKNKTQQQQNDGNNGGRGFGRLIILVLVFVFIGYVCYRLLKWYVAKKEHERQAYRMAQADRVLGDMQMVPTTDHDDNELL